MTRYTTLLLIVLLTVALSDKVYQSFDDNVAEHGHRFSSKEERAYRKQVYDSNVRSIMAHNNDPSATYEQGINQFTIWTLTEFVNTMLTARVPPELEGLAAATPTVTATWNPTPIEYTIDSKKITAVRDQGQCGSCWAFAAVASIESLSFIANGTVNDYSEQQLVSCTRGKPYYNYGCGGGWHYAAFQYVIAKGLASEADYRYTSGGGANGTCLTTNASKQAVRISSYTNVTADCPSVATALLKQPLVVAVNATYWSSYSSGVFVCNTSRTNHEVLLVGVNSSTWKIKNQWGTGWGMLGFMLIDATVSNACTICSYASYPNK